MTYKEAMQLAIEYTKHAKNTISGNPHTANSYATQSLAYTAIARELREAGQE